MKRKIYKIFKKMNLNNPLEYTRKILAPICKEKLIEQIKNCNDCPTCSNCIKKVPIGNSNANIMIINDNATDDESINEYLIELLKTAEIDLNDVFIINSINCVLKKDFNETSIIRLPNRNEIKNCKYFLDYAIEFVKPRVIIVMGATSFSMYKPNKIIEDYKNNFTEIKGIKAIVSHSIKDLYYMLEYMSEEEINQKTQEVLDNLIKANKYLNTLKRS